MNHLKLPEALRQFTNLIKAGSSSANMYLEPINFLP